MDFFDLRYFLNFSFWILVEEAFMLWVLPKPEDWFGRLVLGLVCYLGAGSAVVFGVNALGRGGAVIYLLLFAVFFALTILMWRFCLDVRWRQLFFCCSTAYALQHITYSITRLARVLLSVVGMGAVLTSPIGRVLADYGLYVLSGYVGWRTLMRHYRGIWNLKRGDVYALILSSVILFVSLGLSSLVDTMTETSAIVACRLYAVVSCSLALALQFGLFASDRSEVEIRALEQQVRFEGERGHYYAQGTMDAIRHRCHDLKYRFAALRSTAADGVAEDADLRAFEDEIKIYDTLFETGNSALDLVLNEKALVCEHEGIALSCIADGKAVSFMTAGDLYTFFGNALDNAIEACRKVEPGCRDISLKVARHARVVVISIANSCAERVAFKDGLPEGTSKDDADLHGFGTRSIRYLAERYGGEASMSQEGDTFRLVALFPQEA